MSFHDAATPEDLPPSHQGEWLPDDLDIDEPEEGERDENV